MIGLLSPIWLAGLAAVAVPIALHLWSRRGGRPILVGSIRLLAGAPPAVRRSWTIQDPWLLALRCGVLVALIVALAGPYWIPTTPPVHTVALVAQDVDERPALVDSLRRSGIPVAPLGSDDPSANLWAAIRRADRAAPAGTRFLVFSPDLLRYFRGERPTLRARVDWHVRPAVPRRSAEPTSPPARIVAIFADPSRRDDARYLSAALGAAQSATGIPAVVSQYPATGEAASAATSADWILWLSDRAVPEPIERAVGRGAVLLSDAGGVTPRPLHTRVVTGAEPTDAWLIRSASTSAAVRGAPVWADGTGQPLLAVTREGRGLHYRFGSRFTPTWGDLVLRPAFPLAMARLWAAADSGAWAAPDQRIALSQLLPTRDRDHQPVEAGLHRSLFVPFWILAILLFLAERWWSQRPPRSAL